MKPSDTPPVYLPESWHRFLWLGLGLASLLAGTGCQSTGSKPAAAARSMGTIVEFRADTSVRNPAATDAFPGVRRISVRAVDGRARPDAMLQISDRVGLRAGERKLLLAAESATGTLTLSEAVLQVEAGQDHVIWPRMTDDGAIFAEIRRGTYGETLARSELWAPDRDASGAEPMGGRTP